MSARTIVLAGLIVAAGCAASTDTEVPLGGGDAIAPAAASTPPLRVLLYTKETEWFHPSNGVGNEVLLARGRELGWELSSTKESNVFAPASLAKIDVVVFLLSSGMTMDETERSAFATWIAEGHGWVGVHSASHTDYDWSFMKALVGANFCCHPPIMPANLVVEDTSDPIVSHLPPVWPRSDEWYSFDSRPEDNPRLKVLISLDENSARPDYPGPDQPPIMRAGYHPLTWRQDFGATRSFYTALGHVPESWQEEPFVAMVLKGIAWAGRR